MYTDIVPRRDILDPIELVRLADHDHPVDHARTDKAVKPIGIVLRHHPA